VCVSSVTTSTMGKRHYRRRKRPCEVGASEITESHEPHDSPPLAALWSGAGAQHASGKQLPKMWVTRLGFILCLTALIQEYYEGHSLLGSSNGRMVSFLTSVHAVNTYWPKSRFLSRSVLGTMILKFAGSTVISLGLGVEPIWLSSPRHAVSFLVAFSLVRSDTIEATTLSVHMRHLSSACFSLNVLAALYKLRKMIFLVDTTPIWGTPAVLAMGTLAFSAANLLMSIEHFLLRSTHAVRSDLSASSPRSTSSLEDVICPPRTRLSLWRNFVCLLLLSCGRHCHVYLYTAAKMLAFALCAYFYNEKLLLRLQAPAQPCLATKAGAAVGGADVRANEPPPFQLPLPVHKLAESSAWRGECWGVRLVGLLLLWSGWHLRWAGPQFDWSLATLERTERQDAIGRATGTCTAGTKAGDSVFRTAPSQGLAHEVPIEHCH